MNKKQQTILQEICEKAKSNNFDFFIDFYDHPLGRLSMRGFLLSPATLKSWFGEEKIMFEMWKCHGSELVELPTIPQLLDYYARYKKEETL